MVFRIPLENTGGYYNRTTGVYTVPIDGTYEFIIHILGYEDVSTGAYLVVDGIRASRNISEFAYFYKPSKMNEVHIVQKVLDI